MHELRKMAPRLVPLLALAIGLATAGPALGQAQTGNIYIVVADEGGAPLPGVSVTLTGGGAPRTTVTNSAGEVRFVSLSPDSYSVAATLQGFAKVTRGNVIVSLGQNTAFTLKMKLSGVQESIVVTGESPLLDTRKTGSNSVVGQVELNSVPTARDPWVILQTAPGVQIDRVNVGGSESGQQSQYIGKGANTSQGTWNVDGVNITDMGATGSTPMYFDFDSVAEMNMALGGADASIQTPGVQLNVVTKRGTNDVHGSARMYYETKKWASTNTPDELLTQPVGAGSGNQIDQLQDYGIEMGGPIVKDYVWLWGAYGRNQIDLVTAGGIADKTTLNNYDFKLNVQPIPENSFNAVYTYADKLKYGRSASATRPAETAWNQSGPTKIYKLEDSHVFSSSVFATASYSRVMGGFDLITPGQGQRYQDANGVYHNSYLSQIVRRPQTQFNFTPSFFARTGDIGHEIKVGFTYRDTPWSTQQSVPTGIVGTAGANYGLDYDLAGFIRPYDSKRTLTTYSGYVSDTLTISKLTVQVGVRYDYQKGNSPDNVINCCDYGTGTWPQVPMTSLTVAGNDPLVWKDFSPRLGVTYSLGNDGKTLLKGSYARFVSQMGGNEINFGINAPGVSGMTYLYYEWNDKNANQRVDPGEVNFNNMPVYYYWDPAHPNSVSTSPNKLDYGTKSQKTDEFIVSAEREVMPAFVVGMAGTYRYMSQFAYSPRLTVDGSRTLTPADYTCTVQGPYPEPGGSPQYVNVCNPTNPGVYGNGTYTTNRPGYYQTYWGLDLSATKRYSDKWMARFNFTWSDWTQHGLGDGMSDPSNLFGGTAAEGGILAPSSTASGAKGNVFVNSKWQATLSGMYTLPLDFNVSTSLFARQGYPNSQYVLIASKNTPGLTSKNYQLGNVDDQRLGTVVEWDLGLSKVVKVGPAAISLQLDVFNLLNQNTVLQRSTRVRGTTTTPNATDNVIYEVQSPRIVRMGARVSF